MTSGRIEGHKNYYDLMRRHERSRRSGKLLKILLWLVFFGALITMVVYFINIVGSSSTDLERLKNGGYEVFHVNPNRGDTIFTKSGSELFVPVDAFLDDQGKVIHDTVTLYYSEYRDAVEIAMANIPMNLVDNYMLESAGMFTLYAYNGEQKVRTNKENLIQVNYLGKKHPSGYNNYYLNKKKEWIKVRPEIKRTRFKILGNTEHFPQLKALEKVDWEFLDSIPDLGLNMLFTKTWTYPDLDKNKDSYSLYFDMLIGRIVPMTYGKDSITYRSSLEWLDDAIDETDNTYDGDLAIVNINSPNNFFYEFNTLKNEQKLLKEKKIKEEQKIQQPLIDISEPYLDNETAMNVFYIKGFGTWNCDRPFPINEYIKPNLQFVDSNNKKLNVKSLVAINHELNTVFRFRKDDQFKVKIGSIYTLFYVDDQNKLHYCTTTLKVKSRKIKMKEHLLEEVNSENIRQILKIEEKEYPISKRGAIGNNVTSMKRPDKYKNKNVIWFE